MKDQALSIAAGSADPALKMNLLREYVQAMVLRSLHESEAWDSIAFVGGTCLRFVHELARFSEDLNFTLIDSTSYQPVEWMRKIKRDLVLAGFDCSVRWNDRKTVHTGWIRIAGLMHEAGLTPHTDQNLSIKVEVNTRPPTGARTVTKIISKHLTFVCRFFDPPSLMAGKLHALLTRPYPKGRDWYDFIWYRTTRPPIEPNPDLLQSALDQTQGADTVNANNWSNLVLERLDDLDIDTLVQDVSPFLERPRDAGLLFKGNLRSICE